MTTLCRVPSAMPIVAFLLLGGLATTARGQTPAAVQAPAGAQAPSAPTAVSPATLTILNRPIVEFRAPFLGVTPAERAAVAEERVSTELARGGSAVVTTVQIADHVAVQLNGKLAFVVAAVDANPLLEESAADVARGAAAALERVVRESQEARDTGARLRAAGLSVLYLAGWFVGLTVLARLRRFVARRLAAFAEARAMGLRVGGTELVSQSFARGIVTKMLGGLYGLTIFVATWQLLGLILREFPYTRPWGERLDGFLFQTLSRLLNGIAEAAPDLLVVAIIMALARVVNGLARAFFTRVRENKIDVSWLDADLTVPTQRLFSVVVWLFAIVMAYPYLPGSGSAAFDGLSVLVGLMVSIGGASSVGQAISGLMLMYARTFRVGDYVRIDDIEGTVTSLTTIQTRLRTGMGDEIVLANSRVAGAMIRNYSRPSTGGGMLVDATVTIGYDTPWRQVHGLLEQGARATAGIAAEPAAKVYQTALSDFYVEYRLVCQTDAAGPGVRARIMSELHANIQDTFNAAGVQIMSPHYLADPAAPKVVPRDQWEPGKR